MPRFDHNLNFDESDLEDYEFEEAEIRTEAPHFSTKTIIPPPNPH